MVLGPPTRGEAPGESVSGLADEGRMEADRDPTPGDSIEGVAGAPARSGCGRWSAKIANASATGRRPSKRRADPSPRGSDLSARRSDLSPRGSDLSPRCGHLVEGWGDPSPRGSDLSPRCGHLVEGCGDLSPRRSDLSPRCGHLGEGDGLPAHACRCLSKKNAKAKMADPLLLQGWDRPSIPRTTCPREGELAVTES